MHNQPGTADSFGAQLRVIRMRAGLSQEALAERAGLGVATLRALEREARSRPHPGTVTRLADALELAAPDRVAWLQLALTQPTDTGSAAAIPPALDLVRLPVPPTPLIGRETEVTAARALLEPTTSSTRLLTLVGPGGVGKTRLALAVTETLVDAYPGGVTFVDLAPLRDHQLVAATIARARFS
jgi:transcriptional regulator with XRE-family HTH domain